MTRPGIWKHWKGDLYKVLFDVIDSTNGSPTHGKEFVVYLSLKTGRINTRWEQEFHGRVWITNDDKYGKTVMDLDRVPQARYFTDTAPRFTFIGDKVPEGYRP